MVPSTSLHQLPQKQKDYLESHEENLTASETTEMASLSRDYLTTGTRAGSFSEDYESDEHHLASADSSPSSMPLMNVSQEASSSDPSTHPSSYHIPTAISRKIYISHFLSTWNYRGFEFGSVLFLASIFPGTLLPMSTYALIRAASAIILAPMLGQQIDHGNRLSVIRASILWQRGAVVLSCAVFFLMLTLRTKLANWVLIVLLGITVLLACVEKYCSTMNTVSVERDWVVVIANNEEVALRNLNSQMRRIDLFCKLCSPLFIALIDSISTNIAVLVTLSVNATSMLIEYGLIARVYNAVPALAESRISATPPTTGSEDSTQTPNRSITHPSSLLNHLKAHLNHTITNLRIYTTQPAFLPSLILSLLYLTVLNFSGQMTTYLLTLPAYTPLTISLLRLVSTCFELSSTLISPWLMTKIGPIRAGIWFLSLQMLCLGPAAALFFFLSSSSSPDTTTTTTTTTTTPHPAIPAAAAATILVTGTILSRLGLWGFDLSAQVIIQAEVSPSHRGAFSTTEAALQNLFELLAYGETVVWAKPEVFRFPVLVSVVAVYVAGALYAGFVRGRRGHLVHLSKCIEGRGKMGEQVSSDDDGRERERERERERRALYRYDRVVSRSGEGA